MPLLTENRVSGVHNTLNSNNIVSTLCKQSYYKKLKPVFKLSDTQYTLQSLWIQIHFSLSSYAEESKVIKLWRQSWMCSCKNNLKVSALTVYKIRIFILFPLSVRSSDGWKP